MRPSDRLGLVVPLLAGCGDDDGSMMLSGASFADGGFP